mmetsp:Transcript_1538/g.4229  ORF Transcript_1538/g.4229 Transcript_1538/m.4229 type:complete len:312 (+) Transcript_1538:49-984(+)
MHVSQVGRAVGEALLKAVCVGQTQSSGMVEPRYFVVLPGSTPSQESHAAAPSWGAYRPVGQRRHSVCPSLSWYQPALQGWHWLTPPLFCSVEPAGQPRHTAKPAGSSLPRPQTKTSPGGVLATEGKLTLKASRRCPSWLSCTARVLRLKAVARRLSEVAPVVPPSSNAANQVGTLPADPSSPTMSQSAWPPVSQLAVSKLLPVGSPSTCKRARRASGSSNGGLLVGSLKSSRKAPCSGSTWSFTMDGPSRNTWKMALPKPLAFEAQSPKGSHASNGTVTDEGTAVSPALAQYRRTPLRSSSPGRLKSGGRL